MTFSKTAYALCIYRFFAHIHICFIQELSFSEESVGSSVQCHLKSICNYIYDNKTVQR